jgi:NAD(P)-dependent dehydrogenase (short-subunit alcohol dehydrogenase family)
MSTSTFGLDGKVAVVTGSTAGIGRATARTFAQHGCYVVVNGRTQESCAAAVTELRLTLAPELHNRLLPVPGDVSTLEGTKDFISSVEVAVSAATGAAFVDILVNNVGIFEVNNFFEVDDDKWEQYFQTNLMSGVRLSRYFLKRMLTENKGRVIFVSSECGLRPIPGMIPYSVSKSMQISCARGLAELTKGTHVTVNSVLPGPTMTEGVSTFLKGFAKDKGIAAEEAEHTYFSEYEPTSLLQRFLKPEEIANTILFLVSNMGSGVNGAAQKVEGGIIRAI